MDRSPSTLHQATTADFIVEGHFLGHIRRMRTLYRARQERLLEQLQRRLGGFMRVNPVEAGLHLIGWLDEGEDDNAVAQGLAQQQIYTYGLGDYCIKRYLPPGLLIGFAGTPEEQAVEKVEALARALANLGYRL
ncbi:HTH-type transcriptional regulatory protein GabR [compost metagenome]